MEKQEEIVSCMLFTGKNKLEALRFYGGDWYITEDGPFGMAMRNDVIHDPYVLDPVPNDYVLYKVKGSDRVRRMESGKFRKKHPGLLKEETPCR
ncbi:MAG: hypothetical protein J6Y62_07180 [Clostridia bacterium]|nr:hypothetical protein [Clostridia bacterium]